MLKLIIQKETTRIEKARPGLLFALLGLFLLSACPVQKSINFLLVEYAGLENSGQTQRKSVSANENYFNKGSETCSLSHQNISEIAVIELPHASLSSVPVNLAFFLLLPAFTVKGHLSKGIPSYYSKVALTKILTPTYILNRRLLI